ncbi:MAG TPA: SPOR domain-containing protein [Burkholderiales bacterium]|nr:SPOR domain-containing protein [Burkholderiales bacterium]
MPRAPSDEEIQLRKRARRRLVGAILLVTAAVVILPMVLDQEPRPVTRDIAIHIPSKGSGSDFAPRVAPPVEVPGAATQPPTAKSAPTAPETAARRGEPAAEAAMPKAEPEKPKAEPEGPKPAPPPPEPAAKGAKAGPAAEPKSKPEGPPAAKADAFVVQLDAFSNPENAKQQQKRLADAGIKSFTDTVRTQKGELTRVRVGPYPSREQAELMRDKLAGLGVKAVVVAK